MPLLASQHRDVLSGERGAKAEKRKISESSGRLFLGTFFGGAKKVPRAVVLFIRKNTGLRRRETLLRLKYSELFF